MKFLANLIVAIIERFIERYQKTRAQQKEGEDALHEAILDKAAERAHDAQQTSDDVAKLSDDALFDELRRSGKSSTPEG